jgi:MFS family permease
MIVAALFAFIGGWALDRYGPKIVVLLMGVITGLALTLTGLTNDPWQLFMTYGLLLSTGTGAIYVAIMSTTSRWFVKRRQLALGLAGGGIGLGMVVMAPLATYLISAFDWRMAYVIIGIIIWVIVIPVSMLLKRNPQEIGTLPDGAKSDSVIVQVPDTGIEHTKSAIRSLLPVFRTRSFWLILLSLFLFSSNHFLILTHIVPHATDLGASTGRAAAIISLLGVTSTAGRIPICMLADKIDRKIVVVGCLLCMTVAMLWLIWARELWALYVFAFIYGLGHTGMGPVMAGLVGDTFGVYQIGSILGLLDVGWGLGAAAGPAMGGLIFDTMNSYTTAFIIGTSNLLVVTTFISLTRRETSNLIR